jgi:DNA-binding MarR family transcriptional regulator
MVPSSGYLDIEILAERSLDVKRFEGEVLDMEDSVDFCVADIGSRFPQIDQEVEGVVDRLSTIQKHATRVFEDTLTEHGLSHGEYKLLLRLETRSDEKRLSAGELSKMLMLSSGAMTNRLDRMESAGLVRRIPDPKDRRGVLVELTDKGGEQLNRAVTASATEDARLLEALTKRERTQLNQLLRKVLASLEARPERVRPKAAAVVVAD